MATNLVASPESPVKWSYPKIDGLSWKNNGKQWMIWGSPILGNLRNLHIVYLEGVQNECNPTSMGH
jgi:hypothetical protein